MVAAAIVGSAVVGGVMSSQAQKKAAQTAAGAQTQASELGVEEQRRQFDTLQGLLKPYVDAGSGALAGQQGLIGLRGPEEQQRAIGALEASPMFTSLQQQGENALLQNASATGGLRGGNLQTSLAKFRPALLSQLIEQQYAKLGGITSLGQNAASMTGNAGMNTGVNIANLLGQSGDAQARAALAGGRADANLYGTLGNAAGMYAGLGGFGKF